MVEKSLKVLKMEIGDEDYVIRWKASKHHYILDVVDCFMNKLVFLLHSERSSSNSKSL